MAGGASRGPVAISRQRRTIRLVQGLLVLTAAGLLMFAGYSLGRVRGFSEATRAGELDAPKKPAPLEVLVPALLGVVALGSALGLQTDGGVRLLTPARLRDMEMRGETEGPLPVGDTPGGDAPAGDVPQASQERAGPS